MGRILDVEKNLPQIRSLPKFNELEKAKRKVYEKRKSLRDMLEFYCPRCKREVRALKGSTMFEAWPHPLNLKMSEGVIL